MPRNIGAPQLLIIVLLLVLLIGWKKLPDMARSLGRSMRIFKSEVEQMTGDDKDERRSAASDDVVDGRTGSSRAGSNDESTGSRDDDATQASEPAGERDQPSDRS